MAIGCGGICWSSVPAGVHASDRLAMIGRATDDPIMNRPARHVSRGLLGAGTALGVYTAVVLLVPMMTFSLALLPILLLYTPFAFLLIGMVGVVVELTTERSPATLSFGPVGRSAQPYTS
ncbi:hypothetical protein [Nonomuraea sp. KM90]|uniref:hypothetical protein n=1 Tax=Nonomuraea sp. KM90 TaxID=3457428 RepID=UPI003FCE5E6F